MDWDVIGEIWEVLSNIVLFIIFLPFLIIGFLFYFGWIPLLIMVAVFMGYHLAKYSFVHVLTDGSFSLAYLIVALVLLYAFFFVRGIMRSIIYYLMYNKNDKKKSVG